MGFEAAHRTREARVRFDAVYRTREAIEGGVRSCLSDSLSVSEREARSCFNNNRTREASGGEVK